MKKVLFLICFLVTISIFSQSSFNGTVNYTSTINESKINNYFSKKREKIKVKKNVELLDKIYLNKVKTSSILKFNNEESIFNVHKKLHIKKTDLVENLNYSWAGGSDIYYSNSKTKINLTQNCRTLGECFIIKSNFNKWALTQEKKMIAGYLCYKATKNKKIAWFTPNIPINAGPKGNSGLPGLILELEINKIIFRATKITLNPKEKVVIKKPTKGGKLLKKNSIKKLKKLGLKYN
jgi:GLPGLI family protein